VRGDVIDIFPAESEREAVRVELFDDQIDSISLFDPRRALFHARCRGSPSIRVHIT